MNAIIAYIRDHPLYAVIGLIAVLMITIWFRDAIGGQVERFNRWRFDKAIATERAEITRLQAENAKLLDQTKAAFAKGEVIELQRDAAYAELARYGVQAKAAVEAQKKASEQYETDKAVIAADVPLYQRCNDLCTIRAEVGYPCKPSTATYCEQYRGR